MKERVKNPIFWSTLIITIGSSILAYFSLKPADVTTWAQAWDICLKFFQNPYILFCTAAQIFSTFVDTSTPGILDEKKGDNS